MEDLNFRLLEDPNEILNYLHLGISIPIIPEFKKYILKTFEAYKVKALLLEDISSNEIFDDRIDNVVGITIIYDDGADKLFFGFFGVYDHSKKKIEFLTNQLIEYAKNNNYNYIRGPVNIPAVIFGWGFMEEGSSKSLFISCPINPPIYQNIFFEKGFYIKFEEDRYDVVVIKLNPYKLKKKNGSYYNFSDYEYKNPNMNEIWETINDIVNLHLNFMPPSAQISPLNPINTQVHLEFIYEFGSESHIWTVYHKPTNKMVACGFIVPNPFSKDKKNRVDSASFHDWVVHPDHRRSGLAMLMYGCTSMKVYKEGLRWGSWPVGAENKANAAAARKMKGIRDRRHLILELKLN